MNKKTNLTARNLKITASFIILFGFYAGYHLALKDYDDFFFKNALIDWIMTTFAGMTLWGIAEIIYILETKTNREI